MISESLFRRGLETDSEVREDSRFLLEVGSQIESIQENFLLSSQERELRQRQLRQEVLQAVLSSPNVFVYTDGSLYCKFSELLSVESQPLSYGSSMDTPNVINFESDSDKETDKRDRESNREQIWWALRNIPLDHVLAEAIASVLSVIDFAIIAFDSDLNHFNALYAHNPNCREVKKVVGHGPDFLGQHLVRAFLKFDLASKQFREIHCQDFVLGVDAVILSNHLV